jgi:hypothetical protein
MLRELLIREIFRLADGVTVLACEGDLSDLTIKGCVSLLVDSNGLARQQVRLIGERAMLSPSKGLGLHALETVTDVDLTLEEARNGRWRLVIDD